MRNLVTLSSISGERVALDSDSITGLVEVKNACYKDDQGKLHPVPDHVLVLISSLQFKIKGSFDEVIEEIKEQEKYNNLGI